MATPSQTILIAGGAGYIGSHATLACLDAGFEVVVLDDLSNGSRSLVPPGATFVEGDIADAALVSSLLRQTGAKSLMHFAARISVEDSVSNPAEYYRNNAVKALALFETAVASGVTSIVYSSTAALYAGRSDTPIAEDSALAPCNPYGRSKLVAEYMLRDVCEAAGVRYAALRYFNVAGADPLGRAGQASQASGHLIKVACEVATEKRPVLPIFGADYDTRDGTCIRDYIHVSDLADLHVLSLKRLIDGGDFFVANCGYGVGTSVLEVVAAFERLLQRKMPIDIRARRPGDVPSLVADSSRIQRLLGWRPKLASLDQIIDTAYRWEQRR